MNIEQAYRQITLVELEEQKLHKAFAAAAIATGIIGGIQQIKNYHEVTPELRIAEPTATSPIQFSKEHLVSTVKSKFKVDDDKAGHIVDMAMKYSKPTFPQAHHILSVVGVESGFNERAKSKLRFDPAVGLMQIRPKIWNIDKKEFSTIEGQIKHGSHILHQYYNATHDPDSAIKAYNVGITNFKVGKKRDAAERYLEKFKDESSRYETSGLQ